MGSMKRKRGTTNIISTVNSLSATEFRKTHVPIEELEGTTGSVQIRLHGSPASNSSSSEADQISEEDILTCLKLIETTSCEAYAASSVGWSPRRKLREMRDKDMRYLTVRDVENRGRDEDSPASISGFSSFMFTHEDGLPVAYIYEIHLDKVLRGRGVGRKLMALIERMGRSVGVEKTMLTVFRSNMNAITWYERIGYGIDECSPADKVLRDGNVKQADYLIMSKALDQTPIDYYKHAPTGTEQASFDKI